MERPIAVAHEHDPEEWAPVFRGERIRSPQIMLQQNLPNPAGRGLQPALALITRKL
jgi:hypothetical protein